MITSNTFGLSTLIVDEQSEWRAWDQLPRALRDYLREECPVDFSSEDVLDMWEQFGRDTTFTLRYIKADAIAWLNENRDAGWPVITAYQPIRRRPVSASRYVAQQTARLAATSIQGENNSPGSHT